MHSPYSTYTATRRAPAVFISPAPLAAHPRKPLTTCLAERLFYAYAAGLIVTAVLVYLANH